jgi:hypothetical protein
MNAQHTACQTIDGGDSLCISASSASSGGLAPAALSARGSHALPGLRFGPSALRQFGFQRDMEAHTCAPWPMLDLGRDARFVRALLLRMSQHLLDDYVTSRQPFLQVLRVVASGARGRANSGGGCAPLAPCMGGEGGCGGEVRHRGLMLRGLSTAGAACLPAPAAVTGGRRGSGSWATAVRPFQVMSR